MLVIRQCALLSRRLVTMYAASCAQVLSAATLAPCQCCEPAVHAAVNLCSPCLGLVHSVDSLSERITCAQEAAYRVSQICQLLCYLPAHCSCQPPASCTSGAEGCRGLPQTLQTQLPPEQLVYVAALAVQSPIIFGDQPMRVTLERLISQPSLQALDHAFATQVLCGPFQHLGKTCYSRHSWHGLHAAEACCLSSLHSGSGLGHTEPIKR